MLDLFDLVKAAEVVLGVALAVVVVTGLPLVVTPELGLTVPAGLLVDGDGVVDGVEGVTCGVAVGATVSFGLVAGLTGAVPLGGHTVAVGLAEAAAGVLLPGPAALDEALPSTPPGEPDDGPAAPLVCCEESPTELPSWTKAARSGGSDSATPIANTAQATATTGRTIRCRQSTDGRAWPLLLRPCWPGAEALGARAPGTGVPPSRALCRLIQPPSPEPEAGASAPSVVKAVPAWTRARIRSRPSGRGST